MKWLTGAGAVLMAAGLLLPAGGSATLPVSLWQSQPAALVCAWLAIFLAAAAAWPLRRTPSGVTARLSGGMGAVIVSAGRFGGIAGRAVPLLGSLFLGAALPLLIVTDHPGIGVSLPGLWFYLLGLGFIA